jgi:hypothetical protein
MPLQMLLQMEDSIASRTTPKGGVTRRVSRPSEGEPAKRTKRAPEGEAPRSETHSPRSDPEDHSAGENLAPALSAPCEGCSRRRVRETPFREP